MQYKTAQYFDPASNRARWATLHIWSRVWYFPARYGRKAADILTDRLNREVQ